MAELELVGLHPDGEHLVLAGSDGQRHRLPIDDALRAAVRHDRPLLNQVRTSGELRPRDIQSRIRAGEAAEDIAREAGVPVENVRRYEGPVLAEQAWVAEQALRIPLGHGTDAPALGDLVVDRLAAREVQPEDLEWSAARRPGEGWELVLRFDAGGREREARWSVDIGARSVHALDDEGRWLSETELASVEGRRHLARLSTEWAVAEHAGTESVSTERASTPQYETNHGSHVYDVEVDTGTADVSVIEVRGAAARKDADSKTVDILEGLRASRGIRQEVATLEDEHEVDDAWADPPPAHPPASAPHERPDASVLPLRAVAEGSAAPDAERGPVPVPVAPPAGSPTHSPARASARGTTTPSDGEPSSADARPAPETPPRKSKGRSRRTSVPSWDEIVFGAKPE